MVYATRNGRFGTIAEIRAMTPIDPWKFVLGCLFERATDTAMHRRPRSRGRFLRSVGLVRF